MRKYRKLIAFVLLAAGIPEVENPVTVTVPYQCTKRRWVPKYSNPLASPRDSPHHSNLPSTDYYMNRVFLRVDLNPYLVKDLLLFHNLLGMHHKAVVQ